MSLAVDASVACKWFVEEPGSADADKFLAGGDELVAPDLIVAEVCSAFWKKLRAGQITAAQAKAAMEELPGFFDDLVPCHRLGTRALAIAGALDYPVYDCFYLALAELNDVRLVTADARLLGSLAGTPWAERVTGIGGRGPAEPAA